MSTSLQAAPALESLAATAGLHLSSLESAQDFTGAPTVRFTLALPAEPSKALLLELGAAFDPAFPQYAPGLEAFFAETALRLRNPRPDVHLSLLGLPLSFANFGWPFHSSTSGADTSVVHGEIHLADGTDTPLHARVSCSMTRTFAEVLPAREQPFAEGFIYNAIRKTVDQGQLELVKSGNRQIVPVTTRFYSPKQNRFIFNDTTDAQRTEFLSGKVFWLSHILGGDQPVWIADPRDAQYLNVSPAELTAAARALAADGLLTLDSAAAWATPTAKLSDRRESFLAHVADALHFIKPAFNEDMRSGKTNM